MGLFFWNKHLSFEELNLALDGELKNDRKTTADKHLTKCHTCAQQFSELQNLSQSIEQAGRDMEQFADPASVWQGVEEAIREKKRVRLSWRERFGVSFPVLVARPALAFSIVAMILVFTFFVFQRGTLAENEATINSVTSENKLVMIFKTKERNITVIWLADQPAIAVPPPVVNHQ
ncbi:MAG: hypothetical protein HZC17_02180 [Candidatus Omnitrophica bacterium]|nr:hypothetical protein [Candidatus Omnitrophota bacterium]